MKMQRLLALIVSIFFAVHPITGLAFETDQYNLPPKPLADIGEEVSEYVAENLRSAVEQVDLEIEKSAICLETDDKNRDHCESLDGERKRLSYFRSDDAVADELFDRLAGTDIMFTKFGKWIGSHKFKGQPDRFKTSYGESIFILNPVDYLTISPTVRLFDTEFGIDKLEHFFQQGHQYYQIEKKAVAKDASEADATNEAIKWGQKTERTYYGLLVSGVYSNADLYANYAGMKFYQRLTKSIRIGEKNYPAMLELIDGKWQIKAENITENLLKPFISEHLNEAVNPSSFRFTLVRSVRRAVKKYSCPEWKAAYPTLTATAMIARSDALNLWNDEDYGYTKRTRTVTIAETCFEKKESSQ